jgi:hypothetical protein
MNLSPTCSFKPEMQYVLKKISMRINRQVVNTGQYLSPEIFWVIIHTCSMCCVCYIDACRIYVEVVIMVLPVYTVFLTSTVGIYLYMNIYIYKS